MDQPKPPQLARSLDRRKTIAWILLTIGAGGLLPIIFVWVHYLFDIPLRAFIVPGVTLLVCVGCIMSLRNSYRIEPTIAPGYWHLSIVDFYCVTALTATLLAFFKLCWPDEFVPMGIVLSLVIAFAYLFCLMFAERYGFHGASFKYPCAMFYLLIGFGSLAVGSIVYSVILCTLFWDGSLIKFIEQLVLFKAPKFIIVEWQYYMAALRIGVISLPLGLVLLRSEKQFLSRRLALERIALIHAKRSGIKS